MNAVHAIRRSFTPALAAVVLLWGLCPARATAINKVDGTIAGTVLDSDGGGVVHARIRIVRESAHKAKGYAGQTSHKAKGSSIRGGLRKHPFIGTTSGIGGQFSVTLPPGEYHVTANGPSGRDRITIKVTAGEAAHITLRLSGTKASGT